MNHDEILSIVKDAYVVVWQYRGELEHVWPTPPPEDCRWFAYTEAGEAIDAMLRNNLKYRRNNAKKLDEKDEWADCLIMLLSSMENGTEIDDIPVWFRFSKTSSIFPDLRVLTVDRINNCLIMLLSSMENGTEIDDIPVWFRFSKTSSIFPDLRVLTVDRINNCLIADDLDTIDACGCIVQMLEDETVSRVRGRLEAIKNKQLAPANDRLYSSTDDTQPWVIPSGTTKTVL